MGDYFCFNSYRSRNIPLAMQGPTYVDISNSYALQTSAFVLPPFHTTIWQMDIAMVILMSKSVDTMEVTAVSQMSFMNVLFVQAMAACVTRLG